MVKNLWKLRGMIVMSTIVIIDDIEIIDKKNQTGYDRDNIHLFFISFRILKI